MERINIPKSEWNDIVDMKYWWVLEGIKDEIRRGVRYTVNDDGVIWGIELMEDGDFKFVAQPNS